MQENQKDSNKIYIPYHLIGFRNDLFMLGHYLFNGCKSRDIYGLGQWTIKLYATSMMT